MADYITSAAYTTYADDRGITIVTATLDADIILATDFIDTYYSFKGELVDEEQARKLPTDLVTVADISKAALKAVELQQVGRLTLDATTLAGGLISSESKNLEGVGGKTTSYFKGSHVTFKPRVPELDLLIKPFLAYNNLGLKKS